MCAWTASVWKKYNIDVSVWFFFFLGGPLTVTDANLALGRLLPSFFPKIFGPGENEPLSLEETMKHFHHLTQEINLFLSSNQSQAWTFTEKSRRVSYFLHFSSRMCWLLGFTLCVVITGWQNWGQPLRQKHVRDECGGGCYGIYSRCKWGHVPANQSSDTGILASEVSASSWWSSDTVKHLKSCC